MSKKTPKNITGENYHVMVGNALDRLKELPDNSVDSIVTDPPYGLSDNKFVAETIAKWIEGEREFVPDGKGFMGKAWDAFVPPPAIWDECLRVLKPGGHLLAFFGTRTQDIGALAIRLAGFEIRDSVAWLYGSGFPKSLDISKAIEAKIKTGSSSPTGQRKAAMGDEYEKSPLAGTEGYGVKGNFSNKNTNSQSLKVETEQAKQYEGWGTALKPAHEPIVVARKPISEKTVANNVLQWGTGGLNIDASRIGTGDDRTSGGTPGSGAFKSGGWKQMPERQTGARFPANLILSHSEDCVEISEGLSSSTPAEEVSGGIWHKSTGKPAGPTYSDVAPVYQCVPGCPVAELDRQSGITKSGGRKIEDKSNVMGMFGYGGKVQNTILPSEGGASRFFYVAKASKKDRNEGLDELPKQEKEQLRDLKRNPTPTKLQERWLSQPMQNIHPTVKPTALMEYLVRLVTPVGGTVLDPFTGSGSTGKAAILGGFKFVGCELTEDYLPIIEGRLAWAEENKEQYQADKVKAAQKAVKAEQNTPPKATGGSLTALDAAEVALQAVAKKKGLESNTALPLFEDEEGAE
jgi:site-specific DNA-methyltransferase (adenine-specific)